MKSTLLALETLFIALLSALVLTGCAIHRPLQVAENVTRDTVYINKLHYDSIYIDNSQKVYQQSDTIYKTQIDSIPYEVHIETVREVPRRRNILDYISYACLGLVIGCVLTRLYHYFR